MARMLITSGIVFVVLGLIVHFFGPFPQLFKLPGDIVMRGERYTVMIPLATCLVLTVGINLLLWLWRQFFH